AVGGCSVQVSIGTEDQRRRRIGAIGALEQSKRGENATRCYPEHSAKAIGIVFSRTSHARGSTEATIRSEDQFGERLLAVRRVEIEQGCENPVGCDLEYGAEAQVTAESSRAV